MSGMDWEPNLYGQFAGLRIRPALDLMLRIGAMPKGDICDLGCGTGSAGSVLLARFKNRRLVGVDQSPAMLAKAAKTSVYDVLEQGDVAEWQPSAPPALIFCNAVLNWLPDHDTLLPRLAGLLAAGGTLAVQAPHQNKAPSHKLWHDLIEHMYPGRFDPTVAPTILEAADYYKILSGLGNIDIWETEYLQHLPASDDGHPVRCFTQSTFARPVLAELEPAEVAHLCDAYDTQIETAYPRAHDGSVLFPFRRLFFKLDIPR